MVTCKVALPHSRLGVRKYGPNRVQKGAVILTYLHSLQGPKNDRDGEKETNKNFAKSTLIFPQSSDLYIFSSLVAGLVSAFNYPYHEHFE